jgi:BirA family biotin operon repressor/biotin-[acetyl-CoA-carboxylase] ligase
VTPDEVLGVLLERFADAYADFVAADGRPSLAGWLARAAFLGELITVQDAGRPLTGKFVGIDDDGSLLIEAPGHPIGKVVAGDLVRGPRAASQPG